jgi:hypothetical protein
MPSDDPLLQSAEHALARGDHAEARRRARAVLSGDAPEAHKARARELLGTLSSDRAVLVLLAACLVFFLVIVIGYTGKG